MRAYREDLPVDRPRRGVYAAVTIAVLIIAALAYFALRDSAAPETEIPLTELSPAAAVAAPIATDPSVEPASASATPPVNATNTPAVNPDFIARELPPPRVAVGVGEAPVVQRQRDAADALIINGELLEELEATTEPRPVIE